MHFCSREEIRSVKLRDIAHYLETKRGSDGLIWRGDIDPIIEIPRNASLLMLVEQTRDKHQRIRLVGSKAAEILGGDLTGRRMADIGLKPNAEPKTGIDRVFLSNEMFFGQGWFPWTARPHVNVEWLAQRFARPSATTDADAKELAILAFDQYSFDDRAV